MRNSLDLASGRYNLRLMCLGLALAFAGTTVPAADTDIASAPLFTSSSTAVKPNVMFTLDDSGSMDDKFMPDDMSSTSKFGYWSSQCNGVAYNPAITYTLPVLSTGVAKAAGSLALANLDTSRFNGTRAITSPAPTVGTGVYNVTTDGGNSSAYSAGETVMLYGASGDLSNWMLGTVNTWNGTTDTLNVTVTSVSGSGVLVTPTVGKGDARPYYYLYTGGEPKMNWVYDSSGVVSNPFYNECQTSISSGSTVFTKKTPSATSGPSSSDERQNYANWKTYYSNRLLLMTSGISLAFKGIDDKYRVGFTTINTAGVTGGYFLDVADFGTGHKLDFYTKLYSVSTVTGTPLRGALSRVGQYFAKKGASQTYDPVQYSCQKNFNILSTDGYWNNLSSTSNAALKLDNTAVGQQDGTAARPMFDGTTTTITTAESWTETTTTVVTVDDTPQSRDIVDTITTTHTTPTTWTRTAQSLGTLNSNTSFSGREYVCSTYASGTCTVAARTVGGNNFAVNDTIVISGVTPSAYNGVYTVASIVSGSRYTYVRTGLASRPADTFTNPNGTVAKTSGSSGFCPAGQGTLTSTPQTGNGSTVSTTSNHSTLTEHRTSEQEVTTTTVVTPYTRTTVSVNGVLTVNPAGTPGSSVTTVNTVASTFVAGATTGPVLSTSSTAAVASQPSSWTSGTAVTSCATAAPAIVATQTGSGTAVPSPGSLVQSIGTWGNAGAGSTSTVGPTTVKGPVASSPNTVSSGGSTDSLADVAMYYYKTDLRDDATLSNCTGALGTNVCDNNVAPKGSDVATWQHMTTYTLGLGVSGTLKYDKNYLSQTSSGDYYDLTQGTKDWPIPGPSKDEENIDDLWHAAVNGRGQYFSATDPTTLATSLSTALASISEVVGSGSAAAASNLQPVDGDSTQFVALYVSAKWTGDLLAYPMNPKTGARGATHTWSAKQKLDARVAAGTARTIKYFKKDVTGNTGQLRDFTHANLSADTINGYFDNACSMSPVLSQCADLAAAVTSTAADLAADPANATKATAAANAVAALAGANSGLEMVSWLRGGYKAYYRLRTAILGDIIGGAPVYVRKPTFKYTENAYGTFASSKAGRKATVYVAANDGMLHAIDASSGEEMWAYMPSAVLPKLYRLADTNYESNHQFLVDGAPTVGDIYVPGSPGAWKTILVGGQGAGGRSYYALDITDPENPVALWEFTHPNLGLTYGNPVITKRTDGTWIVAFTSGYNNNVGSGDGNGHLFVVNANTGAELLTIPTYTTGTTPAGTTSTPSGLSSLNVWIDLEIDNTAMRFYSGDLLGNVWRFDIDNVTLPHQSALLLATVQAGSPIAAQPITSQIALGEVTQGGSKYKVLYFGTGKYLGTSDLSNQAQQSVYAIRDSLTTTGLGDVRVGGTLVAQTMTTTTDSNGAKVKTVTKNAVNWSAKNGWYVDLNTPGERVNIAPLILFNTLAVGANIPIDDACTVGGQSYLYTFDIATGGSASSGSTVAGTWVGNSLLVGLTGLTLDGGKGSTVVKGTTSTSGDFQGGIQGGGLSPGSTRRTSWREIVN
jgi:type IV pilus assembly protein PilY1